MRSQRRVAGLVVLVVAFATTATIGCGSSATPGQSGTTSPSTGPSGVVNTAQAAAGERIYLNGVGPDGKSIARLAIPAATAAMKMGGNGCAACHGSTARGKTQRVMGTIIDAPDITYDSLIEAGYTDTTIAGAITVGLDESREPLEPVMPRWEMNTAEVADTIAYLKQLSTP